MFTPLTTCLGSHGTRIIGAALALAAGLLTGGCSTKPAAEFATPDEALASLVAALRANNREELTRILGPKSSEVLSSGDEVADANGRAEFLRLYDEKHRLEPRGEGSVIVDVGATDWPLPIPIVKGEAGEGSKGGWSFDTAAGLDELLSRRIGRNELAAIQVCLAIVDAQREYAVADVNGDGWSDYARKFMSDAGKKDGLYWPSAPGEPASPLGPLVATATEEGYSTAGRTPQGPRPYHGYYYRILTAQGSAAPGGPIDFVEQGHMIGGFGVVAWPADYANSGLKTFITSHHGHVYEKDLGESTDRIARSMRAFNPEAGWVECQTPPEPDGGAAAVSR